MTTAAQYSAEIREFLLGRLSSPHGDEKILRTRVDKLPTARIADWWIFEGKRYRGLDGPLAGQWPQIHRRCVALLRSHNPRWTAVQAPEGEVDWIATAFSTATAAAPEYVCRASKIGLTDDEAAALEGWRSWIAHRWFDYAARFNFEKELPWIPTIEPDVCSEARRLRRWAHVARRSRWPLLRSVVAESLRSLLEPIELDRLPLPTDEAALFELVCLVRVLKALAGPDMTVRWLDHEAGRNTVEIPGVVCRHQHDFGQSAILATSEFDEPLRRAIQAQGVPVPQRSDLLFDLDPPIAGWEGIIVECKSGLQGPREAVHQLKCYSAAWPNRGLGRRLVLAVTEQDWSDRGSTEDVPRWLAQQGTRDVWVFAKADQIKHVLGGLGLLHDCDGPRPAELRASSR